MRSTSLIFASLITASLSVSAGQSMLESMGTDAAKDAVKSAAPSEVTQGAETAGKANALKKTAQDPTSAVKDEAQEKAGDTATDAVPGGKTAKETSSKAKNAEDAATAPSSLMDKAVDAGKSKAKKKATESALDMMH